MFVDIFCSHYYSCSNLNIWNFVRDETLFFIALLSEFIQLSQINRRQAKLAENKQPYH